MGFYLVLFIAAVATYRMGAFIHEIVHLGKSKQFPRFFTAYWNLTAGLFILMPSPLFNSHLLHHTVGIFGTKHDGQYPLIRSDRFLAFKLFILLPIFLPLLNLARVLLTPFDLVFPNLRVKAWYFNLSNQSFGYSSLDEDRVIAIESIYFWCVCFICITNINLLSIWYLISVGAWFLSTLRVPLEHGLTHHKESTNLKDQIKDSVDRPRSLFSFIIQPLGLNYHRTHHRYPGIPYHNLSSLKSKV